MSEHYKTSITATLRSSVVSHAKTLGYTPRSARASTPGWAKRRAPIRFARFLPDAWAIHCPGA